jgi:hypothetical protein
MLKDLIDSLSLTIRLRVIGRTVDQVNPEGRVQLFPKASVKLLTSVRDYHHWNPV